MSPYRNTHSISRLREVSGFWWVFVWTWMHVYMCVFVCSCEWVSVLECVCVFVCLWVCVSVCRCVFVWCIYVFVYMCTCLCVYMYACLCMCFISLYLLGSVFVYIYTIRQRCNREWGGGQPPVWQVLPLPLLSRYVRTHVYFPRNFSEIWFEWYVGAGDHKVAWRKCFISYIQKK